jgi:hypothetical protein
VSTSLAIFGFDTGSKVGKADAGQIANVRQMHIQSKAGATEAIETQSSPQR